MLRCCCKGFGGANGKFMRGYVGMYAMICVIDETKLGCFTGDRAMEESKC
jgi:hypothetical protein